MRMIFPLISLLLMLVSCGAGHIPSWKQNAATDMEGFVNSSFSGNESYAAKYFDKMLDDFRMTVDPDEIVKAYLIKCFVGFALLEYSDCSEAAEMLPLLKNEENKSYYNFVSGKTQKIENIPEKYRDTAFLTQKCDVKKANSELVSDKDPATILVKASMLVKSGCYNAETAETAVNAASGEGWKKAVLKYLALELAYSEKHGDIQKAALIKKRMELVVSE